MNCYFKSFLLFYDYLMSLIVELYLFVSGKCFDYNQPSFSEFIELIKVTKIVTTRNKSMAFVDLKTFYGHIIQAVIFPDEWVKFNDLLIDGECVFVKGELDYGVGGFMLVIKNISIW